MNRFRAIILRSLVVGSLITSGSPALAWGWGRNVPFQRDPGRVQASGGRSAWGWGRNVPFRFDPWRDIRQDRFDIRRDRGDIRADRRDIFRDQRDLHRDFA